jgi:hypothetical protein
MNSKYDMDCCNTYACRPKICSSDIFCLSKARTLIDGSKNMYRMVLTYIKGVAKKRGCFEFHNSGLSFLKLNDKYPFLLSRI